MKNERLEEKLQKALSEIPEKALPSVSWLIANIRMLRVLLDGKTPKNLEELLKDALEKEDYYLFALLSLKKR